MLDTGNMSPAMRAIVGFAADHPRLSVPGVRRMTVDLDNGQQLVGDAVMLHVSGTTADNDLYLADVEGDLWTMTAATPPKVLCSSGVSTREAVTAIRAHLGPAALAVV